VTPVHHLGVGREAGAARGLHENVERLGVALERIRVGARLPHAATDDVGAGFLHGLGGLVEIIGVLRVDRALAGDDEQLRTERDSADRQVTLRQVGAQVHELEGRLDAVDAVDVIEAFQPVDHKLIALVADDGVDGADSPDDGLDLAAELGDDVGHFGQLFGREPGIFREDHGVVVRLIKKPPGSGGSGGESLD
jgi:hypothetical protein